MPYLTFEEFYKMTEVSMDVQEFEKTLKKASAVLDNVTNYFYQFRSIDLDNAWRAQQFKRALCSQVEYFSELGATTFESINKSPQSFQAGRTSVSNASRFNPSGENESKSLVAEEVYMHLAGTGLLFAGVSLP